MDRNDSRPQRHPVIDENDVGAPAFCESAAIFEPRSPGRRRRYQVPGFRKWHTPSAARRNAAKIWAG